MDILGNSSRDDESESGSSNYPWFTSSSTFWTLVDDNNSDVLSLNVSTTLEAATTDVFSDTENRESCDEWHEAQHTLFQTANLCYAAAFLVPHTFKLSALLTRLALCCGYMLATVWAGVFVCAPDIFAWFVAFVVINTSHTVYLIYKHFPSRIHPEFRELYTKLFEPLQMDKKDFRTLLRDAKLFTLSEGNTYAVEDVTRADQRLSILLKGRLKVTCGDNLLHLIHPHHFIDSPEWEAATEVLFQVTITAVEDSRYICWPRSRLQQLLKTHPFLEAVINNLVGKDITFKLYSLNENFNPMTVTRRGRRNSQDWAGSWRTAPVSRSLSVDAVHTGSKGQLRSQMWPAHNDTASDSLGKSETLNFSSLC
uniref:POPDC1-3 domain-containing protein n=1 Tax=Strigamia maritima TaxID=126957 RepID=T1IMG3_STRMM